jgi:hypothetical protein
MMDQDSLDNLKTRLQGFENDTMAVQPPYIYIIERKKKIDEGREVLILSEELI